MRIYLFWCDHATHAAIGEFGLIDWIRRQQGGRAAQGTVLGIGDDCAILDVAAGSQLLVTTDMLMDGRHFVLASDGAEAVGYKAMGVNLSDIAAMAGVPARGCSLGGFAWRRGDEGSARGSVPV